MFRTLALTMALAATCMFVMPDQAEAGRWRVRGGGGWRGGWGGRVIVNPPGPGRFQFRSGPRYYNNYYSPYYGGGYYYGRPYGGYYYYY